jgi:hypothetical protein
LAVLAAVATTRTHDVASAVNQLTALTDGYGLAFRIGSVIALAAAAAALLVPARSVAGRDRDWAVEPGTVRIVE